MDIRKVKKLIEMLENSNLEEIEIQEGEESVRLVKSTNKTQAIAPQSIVLPQDTVAQEAVDLSVTEKETKEDANSINSPMVGTFYASASPGAKPFISVGDIIAEGDVVCIVEAMKMMNEIKSDFSGTVLSVNVENSEPVEYGQSLFEISK
ncbi:MAG: acetyl-CoA carboxylase biotin carboxyl carrier protein [SAR86 cluster bacterium]|jgi:acetyl-CoA carboxylase biotin carboxyl carrier protein|nr:acetyl-CoA carboxylase biotin carboxyl carrier protein [SAR86 cluster bacterium]